MYHVLYIYTLTCFLSVPIKQNQTNCTCKYGSKHLHKENKFEVLIKFNRFQMRKEKMKLSEDMKTLLGISI